MSRAPVFMSIFGYTLARGGRATEAYQLLAELDERALCGEFIPAFSRLGACMGLGDMDGVRRELTIAVSKAMPPSRLWVPSMPLLGESRTNPEVAGCSMRGIAGSMPVQQLWELCRYARFRDRPDDGPANAQPRPQPDSGRAPRCDARLVVIRAGHASGRGEVGSRATSDGVGAGQIAQGLVTAPTDVARTAAMERSAPLRYQRRLTPYASNNASWLMS